MYATAVIGGMYGDEGKGTTVAYFCKEAKNARVEPIVIRHNGGSQSGHTVLFENKRHVFKHIGAGSFTGAPTILSKFFISNPWVFKKEYNELLNFGIKPKIYVDNRSLISLPIDVIINRIIESHRGNHRHGSVGFGIGETIQRNFGLPELTIHPFTKLSKVKKLYDEIINCKWMDKRLYDLGMNHFDAYQAIKKYDLNFHKHEFLNSYEFFMDHVDIFYSLSKLRDYESVIFEGGQGLALDMEYGIMPHVTRSRTGIYNAIEICKEEDILLDEVIYCTRSYTTRHGAGPLQFECLDSDLIESGIKDETNIPHNYQGSLRFSPLNLDLFFKNVIKDTSLSNLTAVNYMMSWLDEVPDKIKVILGGKRCIFDKEEFMKLIKTIGFKYGSFGPYFDKDIKEL